MVGHTLLLILRLVAWALRAFEGRQEMGNGVQDMRPGVATKTYAIDPHSSKHAAHRLPLLLGCFSFLLICPA